jgi:3-oxoacyl-[acyl-carrier-protein] synthase II
MGIAYGSSAGSIDPVRVFGQMLDTGSMQGVTSTTYIQMMPHTAAVNVGLYFGLKGRVIPTSSACTSGSMAIGYAYETILAGREPMMVAGGAEELSAPGAAVFDTLFATFDQNDAPSSTPRPFDKKRDGLVVGEARRRWCWRISSTPRRAAPSRSSRSSASPPIPTACTSRSPTTSSRRAP